MVSGWTIYKKSYTYNFFYLLLLRIQQNSFYFIFIFYVGTWKRCSFLYYFSFNTIYDNFFLIFHPCDPLKPLDLLHSNDVDKPTIWLEICSRFGSAYPFQLRDYSAFAIEFKFLLWKRMPSAGLIPRTSRSPSQYEDH